MPILEEFELTKREVKAMLLWIDIDGSKLCNHLRGSVEVNTFLSKKMRTMVLWGCGNDLVVTRISDGLGVDDQGRLVVIFYIIIR